MRTAPEPDAAAAVTSATSTKGAASLPERGCSPAGHAPQARRPWYQRIDWQASFWTVFLVIPFVFVTMSNAPAVSRVIVCSALVGFAATYVHCVSTMTAWEHQAPGLRVREQLAPVAGHLGLMLLLAIGCLPALTWWTAYFLPYFAGIILFALQLRPGLAIVGALCTAVVLVALTSPSPLDARWMVLGCAASCLSIVAGRIAEQVNANRQTAEQELVAAREREEISRDVHDILGHSLTVLTLKAEVAQRLVAVDPQRAEAELGEIVELSRAALTDVRSTVTRLRTPDLAGQIEATTTACDAAQIELTLRGRARDVPLPQRELLSWALREATTNLLRHAGARRVVVELGPGLLRVTDDGAGLGLAAPGNGLTGLRERIEAAGGTLTVVSPAPDGVLARPTGPGTQLEVVL